MLPCGKKSKKKKIDQKIFPILIYQDFHSFPQKKNEQKTQNNTFSNNKITKQHVLWKLINYKNNTKSNEPKHLLFSCSHHL
jgi:hypothetical protein